MATPDMIGRAATYHSTLLMIAYYGYVTSAVARDDFAAYVLRCEGRR